MHQANELGVGAGAGHCTPSREGWHLPLVGSHTHRVCAAAGICPGSLGLFQAQDGVPDEEREGASQLLIWFSRTALAAQRELGLLQGTCQTQT